MKTTKSIFKTIYVYQSSELIKTIVCKTTMEAENKYSDLCLFGLEDDFGNIIKGLEFKLT